MLISLATGVFSQLAVDLAMPDNRFQSGDVVSFGLYLTNNGPPGLLLDVERTIIAPQDEFHAKPLLDSVQLSPMERVKLKYAFPVTEDLPNGLYFYNVQVMENGQKIFWRNYPFLIEGNLKNFEKLFLQFCGDAQCSRPQTSGLGYFTTGSEVFLKAANPEYAYLYGILTHPDGSESDIEFEDDAAEITLPSPGTYGVKVIGSGIGFKDFIFEAEWVALIQERPSSEKGICIANQMCEVNEDPANCPQDCITQADLLSNIFDYTGRWVSEDALFSDLLGLIMSEWTDPKSVFV